MSGPALPQWTTTNLLAEMLFCSIVLLAVFHALDGYGYRKEGNIEPDPTPESPIRIEGGVNVILLMAIVGVILASGTWNPGIRFSVGHVPGLGR